jgi:cation:H+ antiporter
MDQSALVFFVIGLLFLIAGAEVLVRGASGLAAQLGIPSLIIGLTVVAFGTGSPELAVAVRAATLDQVDLAVGNVIGSNIFNVLFILGLSATIRPLLVHDQLVRIDVPIMILASGSIFFMSLDGVIGTFDGVFLVAGMIAYTSLLIHLGRRQRTVSAASAAVDLMQATHKWSSLRNTAFVIAGFALLVIGSNWLVGGAVEIAHALGVSELVIGLTIVAAGTSLPEVATSIVAGIRGERDIAVGNVVGSNIYNIFAVLGAGSIVSPHGLTVAPAALRFDIPVMVAVAIACLPVFFAEGKITRWEGILFFGYWIAYTAYVILSASQHDTLGGYSRVMRFYVLPLTLITLFVVLVRSVRHRMKGRGG